MSSSAAVVLFMCVVVCLEGQCVSQNIEDGEKTGEQNSMLNQVLDELQSLRDTVGKHEERISQMKDEDKKNKDEIKNLKDEDKKNKDEIKNLKDADQKKTDEINQLKDENKRNKEEMNNLKDADKKKTDDMNHLKDEISNLKDADQKKTDKINQLTGQITSSQAAAVGSSAFMAVMDGGAHFPSNGDVIPFEVALLNLGQNYDVTTSIFTCAESGLYLFSVTLYSDYLIYGSNHVLSGALMVDGVPVAEILSATYDPGYTQYHQSAVTAVVECPQGGTVWVECQGSNSQVSGSETRPLSIFTGYAITYYVHP